MEGQLRRRPLPAKDSPRGRALFGSKDTPRQRGKEQAKQGLEGVRKEMEEDPNAAKLQEALRVQTEARKEQIIDEEVRKGIGERPTGRRRSINIFPERGRRAPRSEQDDVTETQKGGLAYFN